MLFYLRDRCCDLCFFFFFHETATTEIYTLSLHDALPILQDEELLAIIHHDLVDVLVLTAVDEPLGYAELDRRQAGEIELACFGLFPSATGQGLGKYLLNRAMRAAWAHSPQRVWVHTCDLDHPAALPNYLKAGFEVYDEVDIDQFVPEPGENGR